jgi:hypothetical protein
MSKQNPADIKRLRQRRAVGIVMAPPVEVSAASVYKFQSAGKLPTNFYSIPMPERKERLRIIMEELIERYKPDRDVAGGPDDV